MKRPFFIIFTDKDGTLNLDDKNLNIILMLIKKSGGMLIPVTGRTVGDIMEDMNKKNLFMPEIIVGDNGANVYNTKSKKFIIKKNLNHEKVLKIVDRFIENGGEIDNLRFTDGSKIFAANTEKVRKYYKNNKTVVLCDDILSEIRENEDITKITLAGNRKEMRRMSNYVKELDFWTDMDKTKFPTRENKNHRLDIADKNINKGESVKTIVEELKPFYGYICIGNGANDRSMFEETIKSGNVVAIMETAPFELIEEIKKLSEEQNKGKVIVIPNNKNLANQYIYRWYKIFEQKRKEDSIINGKERKFRENLKILNTAKEKYDLINKIQRTTNRKNRNLERED